MPFVIRLNFPRKESKQTFKKVEKKKKSLAVKYSIRAVAMRRVDDIETTNLRKTLYSE